MAHTVRRYTLPCEPTRNALIKYGGFNMKKNITKLLSLLLAAALIVCVFAGCSDSKPAGNDTKPADNGETKTATVNIIK